jgi:hypothetical protein
MSHTITNETWDFAQAWFLREVCELLDDPSGYAEGNIKEDVEELRRIAIDLDLDFDHLIKENGTDYEIERLKKLIEEA